MSTAFIVFFILAIVAALLGLIGVILLINGIVNKNNKLTMRGGILTGIAVIFEISGVFFGARKCFHFINRNCIKNEMKCQEFKFRSCHMPCDSLMMDSTMMNDSCKMKCKMKGDMPCCKKNEKCDPSKCSKHGEGQSQCPHKN